MRILAIVLSAALLTCEEKTRETPFDPRRILGGDAEPLADNLPELAPIEPDPYDVVAPDGIPIASRDLLVIFADGVTVGETNAILASLDAEIVGGIPALRAIFLRLPTAGDLPALFAAKARLKADPRVAAVALNRFAEVEALPPHNLKRGFWTWVTPPDTNTGSWGINAIRMPQAWNLIDFASRQLAAASTFFSVGIIEAGGSDFIVDPQQEDLAGSVVVPDGEPTPTDNHATRVAGIIAAIWDNRKGIEGVYPFPTTIFSRGNGGDMINIVLSSHQSNTGATQQLFDLLEKASVRVINISAGYSSKYRKDPGAQGVLPIPLTDSLREQIEEEGNFLLTAIQEWIKGGGRKDFMVVCSAGNLRVIPGTNTDYSARDNSPCGNVAYRWERDRTTLPQGGVEGDRFFAVEVADIAGNRGEDSAGFGTVSAPGEFIASTEIGVLYGNSTGTSFAAPYVSGLAMYLWALAPRSPHATIREAMLHPSVTVAVGLGTGPGNVPAGTQPGARRIDAFGAVMAMDEVRKNKIVQTALVDVDDGTADGNTRLLHDPKTGATSVDATFHAPDGRRGDGVISMADFRAFRDALVQVQAEAGTLAAGTLELDGDPDHPKRDLNGNGCVGTTPAKIPRPVPNCDRAPAESLYARFDFNGDARVDLAAASNVVSRPMTDLALLREVWPDDPTLNEGWPAADLERLLPGAAGGTGSGEVVFHTALPIGSGDYDELRVTLGHLDGELTRSLRDASKLLVWTIPAKVFVDVKAAGFKSGVHKKDLCLQGAELVTSTPQLKIGQDVPLKIIECPPGGGPRIMMDASVLAHTGWSNDLVRDRIDYDADNVFFETKDCPQLEVGQSCTLERGRTVTYGSNTGKVVVKRVAEREWTVTALMNSAAQKPPLIAPEGGCGNAELRSSCDSSTFASIGASVRLDLSFTGQGRRLTVRCTAKGDGTATGSHSFLNVDKFDDRLVQCASPEQIPTPSWSVADQPVVEERPPGDFFRDITIRTFFGSMVHAGETISYSSVENFVDPGGTTTMTLTELHILVEDLPP